jgi:hypothetical protein
MIKLYTNVLSDDIVDLLEMSGIEWEREDGDQQYDLLRVHQLIFAHNWGHKRMDMDMIHDYVYVEDEELF